MNLLFEFQNGDCNIRNSHVLYTDLRKTGIYGLGTVIYRAPSFVCLLAKQNCHPNVNLQVSVKNLWCT